MMIRVPGVLLLATAGCGATATARAADAMPADEPVALVDVPAVEVPTVPAECRLPSDCGPPTMSSVGWCRETSAWSCLVGQCVWECRGGRRCARAFTREPSECFGPWVRLTTDGTLCSLQSLFTGLPRSVLACRRCQTALSGIEP